MEPRKDQIPAPPGSLISLTTYGNLASDGGFARPPGTRYNLNKTPGLLNPLEQGVKCRSFEHFPSLQIT